MTTSSVVVQVEHSTHTATSTLTKEAAVDADVLFLSNAPTCRVFVPMLLSWEMSIRYKGMCPENWLIHDLDHLFLCHSLICCHTAISMGMCLSFKQKVQ